jgi:hypothetical protein
MKLIHHPSRRIAALIAQTGTQIHNSQVCRLFLEMPLKKKQNSMYATLPAKVV